jgi:hypothetical protein
MTAPPAHDATPAHRRPVSVSAAYDAARKRAAVAIRRAGYPADDANIRIVLRDWKRRGRIETDDTDWWDRLIRELPLGLARSRKMPARDWRVAS